MRTYFILSGLFVMLLQQMSAQTFDKAKLDSYFDALEQHHKFMGTVALNQNGKLIYNRAIGYANAEKKQKANESTIYRIGSITKTFTAILVLKAYEEGKLDLNQTIGTYFPSIKNSEKITIRQLIYHRSGIHNFTNDEDYPSWNTKPKTEAELIEIIAKDGSDFEPDSKASYSNSNFVLLTFILERVFKKPYSELLSKYITKPIGLKNTRYGAAINTIQNECLSYSYEDTWELEAETDMSIPRGAGAIVSTSSDLVKFSDALFSGKLVKAKTLDSMKVFVEKYGIGLVQFPFSGKKALGHTGGIDGFSSIFAHFEEGNISYALISNGSNMDMNDVSIAVLSAAFNKPYEIPDFKTYAVTSEELDQYLGVYATSQIPMKITITKDGNKLFAQGTGQGAFPLEASDKHLFKFDRAGVVIEFIPESSSMILKQGGGKITFIKE